MYQLKQHITISWYSDEIDLEEYEERLEENAIERIRTMRKEYYKAGELHATCDFEGIETDVSGWWEIFQDNDRGNGKECVMFEVPKEDVERVKTLVNDYLNSNLKELMNHKIDQHK